MLLEFELVFFPSIEYVYLQLKDKIFFKFQSSDFWPTIKPFLSKKGSSSNNHITLSENGEIINDRAKVSEVFNDFFINVAKNIGNTNVKLICPSYRHIWESDFFTCPVGQP
jgi:hypothetical protein